MDLSPILGGLADSLGAKGCEPPRLRVAGLPSMTREARLRRWGRAPASAYSVLWVHSVVGVRSGHQGGCEDYIFHAY